MARACSQSTIHPLDTLKVRMQAGHLGASSSGPGLAGGLRGFRVNAAGVETVTMSLQHTLREVGSLYKVRPGAIGSVLSDDCCTMPALMIQCHARCAHAHPFKHPTFSAPR